MVEGGGQPADFVTAFHIHLPVEIPFRHRRRLAGDLLHRIGDGAGQDHAEKGGQPQGEEGDADQVFADAADRRVHLLHRRFDVYGAHRLAVTVLDGTDEQFHPVTGRRVDAELFVGGEGLQGLRDPHVFLPDDVAVFGGGRAQHDAVGVHHLNRVGTLVQDEQLLDEVFNLLGAIRSFGGFLVEDFRQRAAGQKSRLFFQLFVEVLLVIISQPIEKIDPDQLDGDQDEGKVDHHQLPLDAVQQFPEFGKEHGAHLSAEGSRMVYPSPRRVMMYSGLLGSSSIFSRSLLMATSTVRMSPK